MLGKLNFIMKPPYSPLLLVLTTFSFCLGPLNLLAENKLEALREREAKVKALVQKALPAIVCITTKSGNGTGSGVIINKQGLILTAGHVTQATGKELDIIFPDGTHIKGTSLGANYGSDSGLAKIDVPGEYPFVEMGDSNQLNLGDWCIAMGHPGGFNLDRKPPVRIGRVWRRDIEGGIFTDCTLIGGDSGGPLFNLEGKVIGIHSSINAATEHNRHIPVDSYLGDWEDLESGKTWGELRLAGTDTKRPKIGYTFDTEVREGGAKILSIAAGSPNEQLGLKEGDIITKLGGAKINNYWALMRELSDQKVGNKVPAEAKRGNEIVKVDLEMLNREGKSIHDAPKDRPPETKRKPRQRPADEPPAEVAPPPYFGAALDGTASEPRIDSITPDSPAQKAGLQPGDIISSLNDKPTKAPLDFKDQLRSHKPGDKITLKVKRGDKELDIDLTLEKK